MSASTALPSTRPARLRAWVGGLLLAVLAAGSAWADPPARVGRISLVDGNVTLQQSADDDGWPDAIEQPRDYPLTTGDRLTTGRGARAEVQIGSTRLRLDERTRLEVLRLDDDDIRLRLIDGAVSLRLRSERAARDLELVTEAGRLRPREAGLYLVDASGRRDRVLVWRGQARFEGRRGGMTLRTGQQAAFDIDDGDVRLEDASVDAFAQWALEDRDRRQPMPDLPDSLAGLDDLAEHGRWQRESDYGWVWYPTAVSAGWAPFREGRWVWVRPWGWTWVDAAPWGWAPSHYGRWVRVGYRWGWLPGRYVSGGAVYAPAVVGWVGGGVSVSISTGPVGWFPLGPEDVYVPSYRASLRHYEYVNRPYVSQLPRATRVETTGVIRLAEPSRFRYVGRDDARSVLPGDAFRQVQRGGIVSVAPRAAGPRDFDRDVRGDDGPGRAGEAPRGLREWTPAPPPPVRVREGEGRPVRVEGRPEERREERRDDRREDRRDDRRQLDDVRRGPISLGNGPAPQAAPPNAPLQTGPLPSAPGWREPARDGGREGGRDLNGERAPLRIERQPERQPDRPSDRVHSLPERGIERGIERGNDRLPERAAEFPRVAPMPMPMPMPQAQPMPPMQPVPPMPQAQPMPAPGGGAALRVPEPMRQPGALPGAPLRQEPRREEPRRNDGKKDDERRDDGKRDPRRGNNG